MMTRLSFIFSIVIVFFILPVLPARAQEMMAQDLSPVELEQLIVNNQETCMLYTINAAYHISNREGQINFHLSWIPSLPEAGEYQALVGIVDNKTNTPVVMNHEKDQWIGMDIEGETVVLLNGLFALPFDSSAQLDFLSRQNSVYPTTVAPGQSARALVYVPPGIDPLLFRSAYVKIDSLGPNHYRLNTMSFVDDHGQVFSMVVTDSLYAEGR